MYMGRDEAVTQGHHSVGQNISADGLSDVLHDFRTIALDAFPFLCTARTFIGYDFTTELIFSNTGLYIAKPSASVLSWIASFAARSTSHQNWTIFGFASRHDATRG